MAEKVHQQVHAQAISANMDVQSAAPGGPPPQPEDLRRHRRRTKMIVASVALLIIFHTIVFLTLDVTILKTRTPKYRMKVITITNLSLNNSTTSPSFRMALNTEITIKNQNFGPYKYNDCYMTFSYRGKRVSEALITESSVKALSTKKINVSFNVTYSDSGASQESNLRNDISSGELRLSSESDMTGQVEILKVVKRDNKYPKLDCTMTIGLAKKFVQDSSCG